VLPVRPITAPIDGEAGDLDNMPELGLSEDVFAGADEAGEVPELGLDDAADGAAEAESEAEVAGADEPFQAGPDA
jgi:hypothetical protein